MRTALPCLAILTLSMAAAVLGCGERDEHRAGADALPVAIADQEDAVCGMLVREQSAPRAQVVHRDGERAFFCSIGDLLVHLSAPSPHGAVEIIYVEVLSSDEDPGESHRAAHPWRRADDATYVIGVDRPGIMGAPVLAYASADEARQVAATHPGAQVVELAGLQAWWTALQEAR